LDDARKAIFKKYVDPDAYEDELGKLQALSPKSRDEALQRLTVIDQFLGTERPTLDDADAQAAKLGIRRRNLYRLISRLRELGPVTGLAPYARSNASNSQAKRGLPAVAEKALCETIIQTPRASLSYLVMRIENACKASGTAAPSMGAIRNRLAEVRRAGGIIDKAPFHGRRMFGRRILIDQTAARANAVDADIILSIIVDAETRLVIGTGYEMPGQSGVSLKRAISAARRSSSKLVIAPFEAVAAPEELRWVAPDGFEESAKRWACDPSTMTAVFSGERRHGQRLLDVLGPEFEGFALTPRATSAVRRQKVLPIEPGEAFTIQSLLITAQERWNRKVRDAAASAVMDVGRRQAAPVEIAGIIDALVEPLGRVINDEEDEPAVP
jgi:hypothetical protein